MEGFVKRNVESYVGGSVADSAREARAKAKSELKPESLNRARAEV